MDQDGLKVAGDDLLADGAPEGDGGFDYRAQVVTVAGNEGVYLSHRRAGDDEKVAHVGNKHLGQLFREVWHALLGILVRQRPPAAEDGLVFYGNGQMIAR